MVQLGRRDAEDFIGLGRSFITLADNAMYLHKRRHAALDEPGRLLLPEKPFLDASFTFIPTVWMLSVPMIQAV